MSCIEDPEKPYTRRITVWPQWLAAFTICLQPIVSGLANGWNSPYLAQLTSADTDVPLRLTDAEASWVASLLNLGRLIGAILGALSQEYVGRKKVLLFSAFPMASCWIFNICTTSVMWLYWSRFCSGIGSGMMWPAMSLYLGEIADPAIRGSLISLNINAASLGMFLGNVMGSYLSMEMFAYVSLVPNILFVALFSLIPESPYHYALNDNIDEAEASLKWFQPDVDVKAKMQELQDFVDGASTSILTKIKDFLLPANLKNLFIMTGLNVFVYASSYGTINSYAEIIVTNCGINITPSIVVMALGFSTIVAGSTAIFVVDRFGRKSLLIVSSIGTAVSLMLLGLHFYFLSLGFDPKKLTWFPILTLLAFNLFVSYGLVPVPSALVSEMFSAKSKNLASLFIASGNAIFSFTFAKTYQPFLNVAGEIIVFFSYGLFMLNAIPYVWYLIPETKGKSLLEIQRANNIKK